MLDPYAIYPSYPTALDLSPALSQGGELTFTYGGDNGLAPGLNLGTPSFVGSDIPYAPALNWGFQAFGNRVSAAANRLPVHPAPGFGDLVSGFFVVPQNPLQMAREGVSRVPTLGEFMSGSFTVPQNPLWDYSTGRVRPLGQGMGGGCGCGGGCGSGMGALDMSSITTLVQQDSLGLGLPNWGYAAVAVIGYMFLFGTAGGTGRSRASRARRAYRSYREA